MPDFSYINARVCSMRRSLLSKQETEDILTLPGAEAVTEHLLRGPYARDLAEAAQVVPASQAVDMALKTNFVASLKKLESLLPRGDRESLAQLFAGIDLQCIKSLLRGLHHQLLPERIMDELPPAIGLPRTLLEELAEEADIDEAIGRLRSAGSPWGRTLLGLRKHYGPERKLQRLEFALDCAHYEHVFHLSGVDRETRNTVAELAGVEVEMVNISAILAYLTSPDKPELLPQGPRSGKLVKQLAAAMSTEEIIAILADSRYQRVLDKALPVMVMDRTRFAYLERLLDEELLRQSKRLAMQDPLGVAVAYHFVRCKRNEIMNLRLIARGIRNHQPRNALRAALVFVPGVAA